jgi:hypothetical protein
MTFAIAVSLLAALVTLTCAVLLLRHYAQVRRRLLLWSGLCFVGLTAANLVLMYDIRAGELYDLRLWISAGAMSLLMFGLIWDSE